MNAILVGGRHHGLGTELFRAIDHISFGGQPYMRTTMVQVENRQYYLYVYYGCAALEQWEIDDRIADALAIFSRIADALSTFSPSAQCEQLDYGVADCRMLLNESKITMDDRNCTAIGLYADKVPGSRMRTPAAVAGRTLEECIELCMAAGLTTGEIYGHVTDSIYNQYAKMSKRQGEIKYPSEPVACVPFEDQQHEIAGEIGDVLCLLHDMAHVANVDIEEAYSVKLKSFIDKVESGRFYANNKGNLYVRKAHMSFAKPEVKPDDEHDARI